MPRELTSPAILRQYHQDGSFPESMLPLKASQDTPEDPTKPLRGAFEGILLARVAPLALCNFAQEMAKQRGREYYNWNMIPVAEIDEEESVDTRLELLQRKRAYVMKAHRTSLRQVLTSELSATTGGNLPAKVAQGYEKLIETDSVKDQVDGIMSAADTLDTTTTTLFRIVAYDYPKVLGYDPTAREMVDLVGNSYGTYVHPQTGVHMEVDMDLEGPEGVLGGKHLIERLEDLYRVTLIDPSQYHRTEKHMRATGKIKDQKIHCPFAMNSQFTAPFLDEPTQALPTNPLQHSFETLVRKYIGA